MIIFSGNARAAALAGIGFEDTKVELVADPCIDCNTHYLEAEGAFGRMTLKIGANPSPDNAKTSHIAALSIMRLLDNETIGISI